MVHRECFKSGKEGIKGGLFSSQIKEEEEGLIFAKSKESQRLGRCRLSIDCGITIGARRPSAALTERGVGMV